MSDGLRRDIVNTNRVYLNLYNNSYSRNNEMRLLSILDNAPAMNFSNLPMVTRQTLVVSLPIYKK